VLPPQIKRLAKHAYKHFSQDPYHPSLHFKPVHPVQPVYSVRIGLGYRAVGVKPSNSEIVWFWIGAHADYDKLIKSI
jgi:hypothetical protein